MSKIFDEISHALKETKDFIEEHPLTVAALAVMPLGVVPLAGVVAAEGAAAKLLPQLALTEAREIGNVLCSASGVTGALEQVGTALIGPTATKAVEAAAKAATQSIVTSAVAAEAVHK